MTLPGGRQDIRIVTFPETRLAVMVHRGDPARLPETIGRFIAWRKANHLPPWNHATFNLLYGAPDQGPAESFRLDLGVATERPVTGDGVEPGLIPAGRCAVLRHRGSDDGLGAAIARLCRDWLPASGETVRDFPLFLQRVRFFPEVPEHEAVVDIFLPLT